MVSDIRIALTPPLRTGRSASGIAGGAALSNRGLDVAPSVDVTGVPGDRGAPVRR
jgi:hypothetical protein